MLDEPPIQVFLKRLDAFIEVFSEGNPEKLIQDSLEEYCCHIPTHGKCARNCLCPVPAHGKSTKHMPNIKQSYIEKCTSSFVE